jgi:hypothetical protein
MASKISFSAKSILLKWSDAKEKLEEILPQSQALSPLLLQAIPTAPD